MMTATDCSLDNNDDTLSVTSTISSLNDEGDEHGVIRAAPKTATKKRALWKDKGGQARYTLHGDNLVKDNNNTNNNQNRRGGLLEFMGLSSRSIQQEPSPQRPHFPRQGSVPCLGFSSSVEKTTSQSPMGSSSEIIGPPSTRRAYPMGSSSETIGPPSTRRAYPSSTPKTTVEPQPKQPQPRRASLLERAQSCRVFSSTTTTTGSSSSSAPVTPTKPKTNKISPPKVDLFLSLHYKLQKFNLNQF